MRRRPVVARRAFALASTATLLIAAACARGRETSDSTRGADSATSPAAAASARATVGTGAPSTQPALPGALPKPLAQYSAEEFYAFAHSLGYGGGVDKPRKCKGSAGCGVKGGKLTSARVDAVDGQDDIGATNVPANGVIAVKARNTGAYEEARYGMLPDSAYEYYVVVLPAPDGKARWSMQQLVTTPGARRLSEVGTGTFTPCPHTTKGTDRASFHSCTDAHIAADSVVKLELVFQELDSDPIWMRCSAGCCIVQ